MNEWLLETHLQLKIDAATINSRMDPFVNSVPFFVSHASIPYFFSKTVTEFDEPMTTEPYTNF